MKKIVGELKGPDDKRDFLGKANKYKNLYHHHLGEEILPGLPSYELVKQPFLSQYERLEILDHRAEKIRTAVACGLVAAITIGGAVGGGETA